MRCVAASREPLRTVYKASRTLRYSACAAARPSLLCGLYGVSKRIEHERSLFSSNVMNSPIVATIGAADLSVLG